MGMGIVDPYRHSRRPDGFLFSSRPPHNAFRHPDLTDRYHRGWMGICHNHRRSYASDLRYRRPRRALYRRSRPMDLQSHSYPANRPEIATPPECAQGAGICSGTLRLFISNQRPRSSRATALVRSNESVSSSVRQYMPPFKPFSLI